MKTNRKLITLAILLSLSLLLITGCDNEKEIETVETDVILSDYGAVGALADEDLSLEKMLLYALQDEYLARGEYEAIMNEYGSIRPYSNIMKAEETHIEYLREIYAAYGIEFPSDTSEEHIVLPASLLEAARTGVQAEIDNIAMYEKFLKEELPDDVRDVFEALMKGSESHLSAFTKQVDKLE